ncbi:MAG: flavodoxin family protein [Erysipelotrichia bacterium]|nr:flavodoxin family protein [Erysipelotrichia bacterium]NCC54037.1 flavodoxin family protein [Erysipelotrichia bacterium]
MKVILVNGGPHEYGCTYTALAEIKEQLNKQGIEAEIFWVGNKAIAGCIGCNICKEEGKCFRNDIVNEFNQIAKEGDGFIFGTPVHFAAASGMITSFMDRVFYSQKRLFKGKPAAAIVSCRRGGASATFDQINKYFMISNMPVISSQYWNSVHGNTPKEVKQDLEGLQTMRRLADNMAWILKCIELGKQAGISMSEEETPLRTNFIR